MAIALDYWDAHKISIALRSLYQRRAFFHSIVQVSIGGAIVLPDGAALRRLRLAIAMVELVIVFGTADYMLIAHMSFLATLL